MFRESFSFLLGVGVNHGLPRSCMHARELKPQRKVIKDFWANDKRNRYIA